MAADGGESTQAAIREILAKAVTGKWLERAKELVDDTKRHSGMTSSSGEPQHDGQPLSDVVLQTAIVKCRHGCSAAAVQMLMGAPPVPPTPEIYRQVSDLFCTMPLTEEQRQDMDGLTRLAQGKTRARRFTITLKVITEKVTRTKAAAGPGPSGWRNSYVGNHPRA